MLSRKILRRNYDGSNHHLDEEIEEDLERGHYPVLSEKFSLHKPTSALMFYDDN